MKGTLIPKHYSVNITPGEMFSLCCVLDVARANLTLDPPELEAVEAFLAAYQGDLPNLAVNEPLEGGEMFPDEGEGATA